jgi:hypothetical protein
MVFVGFDVHPIWMSYFAPSNINLTKFQLKTIYECAFGIMHSIVGEITIDDWNDGINHVMQINCAYLTS